MGEDTLRAHCQTPLPHLFQICHVFDKPLFYLFAHQATSTWTLYTSASSFIESLCSSTSPVIAMHTGTYRLGSSLHLQLFPASSLFRMWALQENTVCGCPSYGSLETTALRFGIAADPFGGLHYTCTSRESARITSIFNVLTHKPRRDSSSLGLDCERWTTKDLPCTLALN
jgi:hypothetical protein